MAALTEAAARERLKVLPGWELHGGSIRRSYKFPEHDTGGLTARDFRLAQAIDA